MVDNIINYIMIGAMVYALIILHYIIMKPDRGYEKLKQRLADCYNILEKERENWQQKLRLATAGNRAAIELFNALNSGAVAVKCPVHGKDATVLADGTIVCPEGHRLWPKEEVAGDE